MCKYGKELFGELDQLVYFAIELQRYIQLHVKSLFCNVLNKCHVLVSIINIATLAIDFISAGQDNVIIIIEEGPQSLLIPSGHVATFSCKSCCTHCVGHWVINGIPAQEDRRGRRELESMGFTFPEDESNQQCHVMVVKINVSESVNASSIRCDYCTTPDQFIGEVCRQSNNATLLVTSSKY